MGYLYMTNREALSVLIIAGTNGIGREIKGSKKISTDEFNQAVRKLEPLVAYFPEVDNYDATAVKQNI